MAEDSSASIGLAIIVKELKGLREIRATGTYYVVSSDNRQVRFGLAEGEVTSISARAPNLSVALDAIASLKIVRTSFAKDGLVIAGGAFGFSTDELIHGLLYRAGQAGAVPAAPATPAPSAGESAATVASLSSTQHETIRKALVEYLGPMGEFVYEEHLQAGGTLKAFLTKLVKEIPDRRNSEQFIALVRPFLET